MDVAIGFWPVREKLSNFHTPKHSLYFGSQLFIIIFECVRMFFHQFMHFLLRTLWHACFFFFTRFLPKLVSGFFQTAFLQLFRKRQFNCYANIFLCAPNRVVYFRN